MQAQGKVRGRDSGRSRDSGRDRESGWGMGRGRRRYRRRGRFTGRGRGTGRGRSRARGKVSGRGRVSGRAGAELVAGAGAGEVPVAVVEAWGVAGHGQGKSCICRVDDRRTYYHRIWILNEQYWSLPVTGTKLVPPFCRKLAKGEGLAIFARSILSFSLMQ